MAGWRMFYQESTLVDSLSRVVNVDLIDSTAAIIQSATFPVREGKISGGWVVPQDLRPGDYALRAYTHWNRNFGEDDQFLTPFVVMEAGYQPEADMTIALIMGTLIFVVEGPENGYTSIPVGMYWAIVTLTTVGFGDITPQTPVGQLLPSLIMLMGYAIIAVRGL